MEPNTADIISESFAQFRPFAVRRGVQYCPLKSGHERVRIARGHPGAHSCTVALNVEVCTVLESIGRQYQFYQVNNVTAGGAFDSQQPISSLHAVMPSSYGMLLYNTTTTMVKSNASGGNGGRSSSC